MLLRVFLLGMMPILGWPLPAALGGELNFQADSLRSMRGTIFDGAGIAFDLFAQPMEVQQWFAPGLIVATLLMAVSAAVTLVARRKLVKRSAQSLGMSEQRYRQIVETSHEGIATYDAAGICTMANEEYARILGLSMGSIIGQPFQATVSSAVFDYVKQRYQSGKEDGDAYDIALPTPGGVKQISVVCRPMPTADGVYTGSLTTLTDMTNRILAEDAIRSSEANYRQLFESSPNARMLVDRETLQFHCVNHSACQLYGYSREEFSRITMLDLQVPNGVDVSRKLFAGPLIAGAMARQHRKKDGTAIAVEVYAHDHDFEGRSCRQVLAINKTQQVMAANRLKESEQALAMAQQIAHIGSFHVSWPDDSDEPVRRRWSDEMYRIVGVEPGTISIDGLEFAQFVHPEDRAEIGAIRHQALKDGTSGECKHRLIRADGAIRFVRTTLQRMPGASQPTLIGTVQDITEHRALEEQLQQAQRLDSIGRLAGGVAHDFNNLLTVINGYSKLILKQLASGTPLREDVQHIADAGREAAELTKRLLAFGRKQVLTPVALDLNEVIAEASILLKPVAGEDILVVTRLSRMPVSMQADRVQMNQMLINLTTNARDAMPRGGTLIIETAHVLLDEHFVETHPGSSVGRHVRLKVSDTGVGMDAEMQLRIFEPFFTTKDRTGGTGLGLATVYGIIKQSGGSIHLESMPGKGTSFQIFLPALPIVPDAATAETATNRLSTSDKDGSQGGNKIVLVVEDQLEVRRFVAGILQGDGYRVLEAANGKEALSMLEVLEEDLDLLVTDIVMPGMSGFELVQNIGVKPAGKPLAVLYMSGYPDGKLDAAGARPEGVRLLEKPFSSEDLLKQAGEAISNS